MARTHKGGPAPPRRDSSSSSGAAVPSPSSAAAPPRPATSGKNLHAPPRPPPAEMPTKGRHAVVFDEAMVSLLEDGTEDDDGDEEEWVGLKCELASLFLGRPWRELASSLLDVCLCSSLRVARALPNPRTHPQTSSNPRRQLAPAWELSPRSLLQGPSCISRDHLKRTSMGSAQSSTIPFQAEGATSCSFGILTGSYVTRPLLLL